MYSTSKILIASFISTLLFQNVSTLNPACPKCGDTEVPYPFSTNDACGDTTYKLFCIDNTTLEFPSAKGFRYQILSIDTSKHSLTISPPKTQPNTCYSSDFSFEGLRLEEGSPFNISARNTVMLFNCSNALLRSPLNCSSNSLCRVFEDGMEGGSGCRGTLCCHYLKDSSMSSHFIRVRSGGCTAYTSVVNINADEPVEMWNYGIELQWLSPKSNLHAK